MEENKKGEILLYQTIDGVSKIEVTVYNDSMVARSGGRAIST